MLCVGLTIAMTQQPQAPNILVTGTPCTGKTSLCQSLATQLGFRHVEVSAFARERNLLEGYNDKLDCHYLDEEGVLDELEPIMVSGGVLLDHHSVDWFPERWIHLVVVLRASTHVLHDRLTAREYSDEKRNENMQAEIMQVVLDEAKESYPNANVLELLSDTQQQQQDNTKRITRALANVRVG